jgi:hypothetical protein
MPTRRRQAVVNRLASANRAIVGLRANVIQPANARNRHAIVPVPQRPVSAKRRLAIVQRIRASAKRPPANAKRQPASAKWLLRGAKLLLLRSAKMLLRSATAVAVPIATAKVVHLFAIANAARSREFTVFVRNESALILR